jgi:signal transduction histidine kinase/CheY-like chemotaxis protein
MIRMLRRRVGGDEHAMLVAASLVIPLLVFFATATIAWLDSEASGQARVDRALRLAHENATRVVETYDLLLREAVSTLSGRTDDEITAAQGALSRHWARLVDKLPQVDDLYVTDREGRLLVSTSSTSAPGQTPLAGHLLYPPLDQSGTMLSVGLLEPGTAPGRAVFAVALARRDVAGRLDGAVSLIAWAGHFTGYWQRNGIADAEPQGMTVVIFRADGAFLARWPQPLQPGQRAMASDDFQRRIAAESDAGTYEVRSPNDGIYRLLAYRRVEGQPFYVVASLRYSSILSDWLDRLARRLYFGIPATLALFLLARTAAARSRRESAALAQLRAEVVRREGAEAALRQSQKMEAIGLLSGGIAHDFNNLLTAIGGSIDILVKETPALNDRARRYAAMGREAADRAAVLTHRLLAFARQQPLEPRPLDLNTLVAGMSELLRRTLGEDIEIEIVQAGGLWLTSADLHQVENALLNLAVNARDAMPAGGRLTIETANARFDESYAAANPEVAPGQYVLLAVSDTGTGMPPDIVARAVDPFFTTKPQGRGTGLGLSMIYGFAKQSGGHLKIYSEVGRGTTVKLYLPRTMAAPAHAAQAQAELAPLPPACGETILVVEDDEGVREFSTDSIRELGYEVLVARDAAGAMELMRADRRIDLLFTDVVLPGQANGRRLAEEVRLLRPHLPVLFTTGYTPNAIIHNGMLDAGVNFIAKPFTVRALAVKLRAVLDAARTSRQVC